MKGVKSEILNEEDKLILLNDQKELKTESVSKSENDKSTFIAKQGRKYLDTSTEARSIQKQRLTLKQDLSASGKEIKETEDSISCLRKQLEITEEKYEREKGYFQKSFDSVQGFP